MMISVLLVMVIIMLIKVEIVLRLKTSVNSGKLVAIVQVVHMDGLLMERESALSLPGIESYDLFSFIFFKSFGFRGKDLTI